jgi:hypothetical protein
MFVYYVLRAESGEVLQLVRFQDRLAYVYEGGEWVFSPHYIKIGFEVTDYEEVSEAEAMAIIAS